MNMKQDNQRSGSCKVINGMRLDKLLVERGIVQSRERASALITNGKVLINGKRVKKKDSLIQKSAKIDVEKGDIQWVSRGGLKLEQALYEWNINPRGYICLDVGASTGGFTDVLLTNGAKKIYALDVGRNQLAEKLKKSSRVINLDGVNARKIDPTLIHDLIDLICIDLAFISSTLVIGEVLRFLKPNGKMIILIKPQFEVGKENVGKKGVVKNIEQQKLSIVRIQKSAQEIGLTEIDIIDSPILGIKGNKEFLAYFKKDAISIKI